MNMLLPALLVIVGLINFLPVAGLFSAERLSSAYGIELLSNDLIILMRHRALLFGVVGGFILYSVFVPAYQSAAMVMAAISMTGYLYLVWAVGGYNASIFRVAVVDMVGIACSLGAAASKYIAVKA